MLSLRLALLALGLLLVPAVAYSDGTTSSRTLTASVVADADAYLKAVKSDVTLTVGNAYTATFLTLTHQHVSGTSLDVTITKTAGDARFTVSPSSGTLGGPLAVTVTDSSGEHAPITDTLTVRVDAVVRSGAADIGFATFTRSVTVTV